MPLDDRSDRIRKGGPALIYMQVADDIAADIQSGKLQSGTRLPPGTELAERYGVAVMSIRRANHELVDRGLVEIVKGMGTYVV